MFDVLKILPVYKSYFDKIRRLRDREFEHLGYWVDLYAIETKLARFRQEDRTREPKKTLDVVSECISQGKNAVIFGDSGSGKTFTCLKLFERFKEEYCTAPNEKIPLFTELSRTRNNELAKIIKEGIDEEKFNQDTEKYIIFLDGLNEVGGREE